jgi:predicted ABC-type ATPase
VFAGPNGSGKSTIIQSVRDYKTEPGKIDFGIYVNADDIVNDLKQHTFSFAAYQISPTPEQFTDVAAASGLLDGEFTKEQFKGSFSFDGKKLILKNTDAVEHLAQIIADFLRKELLRNHKKFSFETVFSHKSKLEIMQQARQAGYKVYLYFVSTNSPAINVERVALRVKKGGHDVPRDKIISRYSRSLNLLFEAAQLTHQTFFFDNSKEQPHLFTNFKLVNGKKEWKPISKKDAPDWFIKYYAQKVKRK